jgi:hypothetical protein
MAVKMRYALLKLDEQLQFVEFPSSYMYQLTALNQRLHKEVSKLTAADVPALPILIAEFDALELIDPQYTLLSGLDYMNQLEKSFANIQEEAYPLISLLTEIRALQAQMEQWYEELADGLLVE